MKARGAASYLDATAIDKRFGRKVVLDGSSVSVRAGEAVALVSENRVGKEHATAAHPWILAGGVELAAVTSVPFGSPSVRSRRTSSRGC